MLRATSNQDADYVLGHSDSELRRLVRQSQFFDELTVAALQQAGLGEGMRVLDVGCGAGDVSFLAARMVGPSGAVIGIDKSADAVALATDRASAAGLTNVHFLTRDALDLDLERPVDALIGRLVLMYLAEPATVLRRLATFVEPGGLVLFHRKLTLLGRPRNPIAKLSRWRCGGLKRPSRALEPTSEPGSNCNESSVTPGFRPRA